jgi:S1-C subfamily serine protease
VVVYGFPLLGDLSSQGNLTYGIVSALSGLEDDLSRLQMTAQIQPGNSGGPVLNRFGEIVGVVVETANEEFFRQQRGTDTQNLNFAIRDSMAVSFLETNNVNYAVGGGQGSQMAIADIAEAAQEFTGLIMCYQ